MYWIQRVIKYLLSRFCFRSDQRVYEIIWRYSLNKFFLLLVLTYYISVFQFLKFLIQVSEVLISPWIWFHCQDFKLLSKFCSTLKKRSVRSLEPQMMNEAILTLVEGHCQYLFDSSLVRKRKRPFLHHDKARTKFEKKGQFDSLLPSMFSWCHFFFSVW